MLSALLSTSVSPSPACAFSLCPPSFGDARGEGGGTDIVALNRFEEGDDDNGDDDGQRGGGLVRLGPCWTRTAIKDKPLDSVGGGVVDCLTEATTRYIDECLLPKAVARRHNARRTGPAARQLQQRAGRAASSNPCR